MALPKTFSSGERLFASDLNSNFEDLDGRDLEDLANVSGSPASGDKLVFNGSAWEPLAGYIYAGTRYYTSSGTFAKADPFGTGDIGLRAVKVTVVAGGAGGGGCERSGASRGVGAGGGAGGFAISFVTASSLSSTETVTVGGGGTGGRTTNGSNGGNSSFGAHAAANGGIGGALFAQSIVRGVQGSDGGSGTTGDITGTGQGSGPGLIITTSTNNYSCQSGMGGSSIFGGGGHSVINSQDGDAGGAYGAGGSGSATHLSNRRAGAGGAGIVIVECYV